MTPPESQDVALELERLRGTCAEGFAKLEGALAVLVERSDRNEADVKQLREDMDRKVRVLRGELEEFKRGRWPLPSIGALTGVAGAVVAVIALVR